MFSLNWNRCIIVSHSHITIHTDWGSHTYGGWECCYIMYENIFDYLSNFKNEVSSIPKNIETVLKIGEFKEEHNLYLNKYFSKKTKQKTIKIQSNEVNDYISSFSSYEKQINMFFHDNIYDINDVEIFEHPDDWRKELDWRQRIRTGKHIIKLPNITILSDYQYLSLFNEFGMLHFYNINSIYDGFPIKEGRSFITSREIENLIYRILQKKNEAVKKGEKIIEEVKIKDDNYFRCYVNDVYDYITLFTKIKTRMDYMYWGDIEPEEYLDFEEDNIEQNHDY